MGNPEHSKSELALKRGKHLNSLTFHFRFCLFVKYGLWVLFSCGVFCLFVCLFVFKGNEMEFEGTD